MTIHPIFYALPVGFTQKPPDDGAFQYPRRGIEYLVDGPQIIGPQGGATGFLPMITFSGQGGSLLLTANTSLQRA